MSRVEGAPTASSAATRRVLLVVNHAAFLQSHRLPIAEAARQRGYDVVLAAADAAVEHDPAAVRALREAGFRFEPVPFARAGGAIGREWQAFTSLLALYRRERPHLVHHVTIRPVIFGSIAARVLRVPAVVNAVPGLGYVFLARGVLAAARRAVAVQLYRIACGHPRTRTIFQNDADATLFRRLRVVRDADIRLVRGSGVDLEQFPATPFPSGIPLVVLPARLLADKGVREFVAAAAQLRREGVAARFALVGAPDPNPSSISSAELSAWAKAGDVELWGHRTDMPTVYAAATIVCLPSYREGLPKALLEAQAVGRPIVTTDVPGCRDAIEPEVTGVVVPARSAEALSDALRALLQDPERCQRMAHAARARAEALFGASQLAHATVDVYDELTQRAPG